MAVLRSPNPTGTLYLRFERRWFNRRRRRHYAVEMVRALLIIGVGGLVAAGIGYVVFQMLTSYGDDPFMLMVLAVPIVALLALLLQTMRR